MVKIILTIWNYFRPSWEGADRKFSYKRASAFVFVWLMVVLALRGVTTQWEYYTFLTLALLFAVIAGVITIAELLLMFKYYSENKTFNYLKEEDTESVDALNETNEETISNTDTSTDSK